MTATVAADASTAHPCSFLSAVTLPAVFSPRRRMAPAGVLYVPLFLLSYGYFLTHHVVSARGSLICLLVSPLPEIYFALKRLPAEKAV